MYQPKYRLVLPDIEPVDIETDNLLQGMLMIVLFMLSFNILWVW